MLKLKWLPPLNTMNPVNSPLEKTDGKRNNDNIRADRRSGGLGVAGGGRKEVGTTRHAFKDPAKKTRVVCLVLCSRCFVCFGEEQQDSHKCINSHEESNIRSLKRHAATCHVTTPVFIHKS